MHNALRVCDFLRNKCQHTTRPMWFGPNYSRTALSVSVHPSTTDPRAVTWPLMAGRRMTFVYLLLVSLGPALTIYIMMISMAH